MDLDSLQQAVQGASGARRLNAKNAPTLECTLTCPRCGHVSLETMPTNACQYFHACAGCTTLLRPLPGDCCVYCSFGSVPCPSVQNDRQCGG